MVAFGDSAANPPEVNYYTLMAGDHAASATAAAAAHQVLADALAAEMALMGANTAATATCGWQGVGGTSMVLSAAQLMEIMSLAVAWLQQGSLQAAEIVQAYHTAAQTMIPGPVCDSNRVEQASLVASNIIGQNTPAIIALDTQYLGGYWPTNASIMALYQAVVSAALALLATPPPFAPTAANPAAPLAGVAQAGAQAGANALQSGFQNMNQTANAAAPAGQAPATAAGEGMSSAMGMPMAMLGQLSQVGQIAGQAPQMLGQAPQMLSQAVQLPMGLMGPLSGMGGGVSGMNGAATAAEGAGGAALSQASLAAGGAALAGGGGGGGLGSAGSGVVSSSFTRPASSFAAPNAPNLPGGWSAVNAAPEPVAGSAQRSGMGGGGLYGAPMSAMGRDGAADAEKQPTRTMQLTARPAADRGDR